MFPLRLSSAIAKTWRGRRFVRGTLYEFPEPSEHAAALASGHFIPARPRSAPAKPEAVSREPLEVVVVRDTGLGDVLMALPAVQELGRRIAPARVSYAVGERYRDLVALQPGLFQVYSLEHDEIPDRRIDLRGLVERSRHQTSIARQVLFAEAVHGRRSSPAEVRQWSGTLRTKRRTRLLQRPVVAIAARGSCGIRSISRASYLDTVSGLLEAGASVIATESDAGDIHSDRLVVLPAVSVGELASVIAAVDVVVGPDTGILHLAGHLRKPIVGVFTTWAARLRLEVYDAIAIEPEGLTCFPCFDHGCAGAWCSASVDPREVVAAVAHILAPRFRLALDADTVASSGRWTVFGDPVKRG